MRKTSASWRKKAVSARLRLRRRAGKQPVTVETHSSERGRRFPLRDRAAKKTAKAQGRRTDSGKCRRAGSTTHSIDAPHARSHLRSNPHLPRACSGQCYAWRLGRVVMISTNRCGRKSDGSNTEAGCESYDGVEAALDEIETGAIPECRPARAILRLPVTNNAPVAAGNANRPDMTWIGRIAAGWHRTARRWNRSCRAIQETVGGKTRERKCEEQK